MLPFEHISTNFISIMNLSSLFAVVSILGVSVLGYEDVSHQDNDLSADVPLGLSFMEVSVSLSASRLVLVSLL